MRRAARSIGLLLFAALLGACSKPTYFPIDDGASWQYSASLQRTDSDGVLQGAPERASSQLRVLPSQALNGREVVPISVQLGARYATNYHLVDSTGVHLIGVQASGEHEPKLTPDAFVLRYPLVAGRSWDDTGYSVFLDPPAEVTGETRVVALDATVSVPAGTYTGCLEVHFSADEEVKVNQDPGLARLSVDTTSWYAPGVGMVKYVQRDRSPAGSGIFTVELSAYNAG